MLDSFPVVAPDASALFHLHPVVRLEESEFQYQCLYLSPIPIVVSAPPLLRSAPFHCLSLETDASPNQPHLPRHQLEGSPIRGLGLESMHLLHCMDD